MNDQLSMFDPTGKVEQLDLDGGDVTYHPTFLTLGEADRLLEAVNAATTWRQEMIWMYGREVPVPRLTAWVGDPGKTYTYSNIALQPEPWTSPLLEIKQCVEHEADVTFNSVLLNLYRSGTDGVAWHSDDEPELGRQPVIASVSLGATRRFQLRQKSNKAERCEAQPATRQPADDARRHPTCLGTPSPQNRQADRPTGEPHLPNHPLTGERLLHRPERSRTSSLRHPFARLSCRSPGSCRAKRSPQKWSTSMRVLIAIEDRHARKHPNHRDAQSAVDGELVTPPILECVEDFCAECNASWFGLSTHMPVRTAMVVERPHLTCGAAAPTGSRMARLPGHDRFGRASRRER